MVPGVTTTTVKKTVDLGTNVLPPVGSTVDLSAMGVGAEGTTKVTTTTTKTTTGGIEGLGVAGTGFGVEGPGVGGVGYGTASMAGGITTTTSTTGTGFGVEGPGVGGVGYGTSQIGTTGASATYGQTEFGGAQTTTTTTTTTTNVDTGLASTIQPGFLPSAYASSVQESIPLEQQLTS